ncbi:LamG-like jellyroll fold domain-containing protein [Melittangium boletus]|uniref:LamG-like jellyroll fold domain-containing protein n=1 Tax=Melittangium boletus TaxID=83453 RepID=UPI003DA660C5
MPQTQLPANFAGVLSMSAGQQMDLGVPVQSLDGLGAFTVSGWFQVPTTQDTVTVLSQGDLFGFSFYERRATVTMRGGTVALRMAQALPAGQFHQLAAIYTPGQNGANSTLAFFVDGACVEQASIPPATPTSGTPPHLVVGAVSQAVAVRRVWLTDTAVDVDQVVNTRFGTTGTAPVATQSTWDWGQVPAAIIGAPTPVAINGATPSLTTPGLVPGASGTASMTPIIQTSTNAVTLQGWFYFPPSVSSAQVGQQQTLALVTSTPDTTRLTVTPQGNGTWSIGTSMSNYGFGTSNTTLAGWHNLAATWVSGGDAYLYLDGTLISHSVQGVTFALSTPSLTVGGVPASGGGATQTFRGSVQNVAFWPIALPGEDIQACLMPWFPMQNIDPVAVCDFTQDPPLDVVSGSTLTLAGGASVQDMLWPASSTTPAPQMLVAQPKRRQSLKNLRPQNPPTADPALYSQQKENDLLQSLRGYLAQAGNDPRVATLGPDLEAQLKARFARGRAGNPDLTGIVHTEQQGNEWITFYYAENGPEAIHRRAVTNSRLDSCTNWVVDFTATALFGLLGIMGIPLSRGVAVKALQKLLGKAAIWKAVGKVIESTLTSKSIVALVKAIYDNGGLTAFVKAVLDGVSWWDFLWMVAQVIIELVGLLVPGAEEALIVAKCTLVVAQLAVVASHKPANCPS